MSGENKEKIAKAIKKIADATDRSCDDIIEALHETDIISVSVADDLYDMVKDF